MTAPSTAPAVTPPVRHGPDVAPVAGLDLLHASERAADTALLALADVLPPAAGGVHLATHWAQADGRAHVALSVEVSGLSAELLWQLLGDLLVAGGAALEGLEAGPVPPGLLLGDGRAGGDRQGGPAWAVCIDQRADGPASLVEAARSAASAHIGRRSGRLVRFPGVEALTGTLPVGAVLQRSAIDRVRVLGGAQAEPQTLLVTREHVRPSWVDGELVLLAQPAVGGCLVPFEAPDPTRCCADHG